MLFFFHYEISRDSVSGKVGAYDALSLYLAFDVNVEIDWAVSLLVDADIVVLVLDVPLEQYYLVFSGDQSAGKNNGP